MNYGLIFLFLSLNVSILCAGFENHLKKITDKSGHYTMKNIDFIYMINLDQRPEKFASCVKQLSQYGIEPFRFSAVNGWALSLETINDVGVRYEKWMPKDLWGTYYVQGNLGEDFRHEIMNELGRVYFSHCMARGPIGIILSHLSILKDAYDSGYNTIWVNEDDIQIVKNPHILSSLIDKLDALVGKKGWDILFTDRDTKNRSGNYVPCLSYARRPNFTPKNPERFAMRTKIGADFIKIGARYGAYSMIIRRSGMKKLLNFFNTYSLFLPYDMDFTLPDDIQLYAVVDDIVSTQPQALSDNSSPGYLNKLCDDFAMYVPNNDSYDKNRLEL
jgi:GR25 family glycosyltransferase involved in LPS biosynthesis